jgi:activator of HSP90 ATPase
LWKKPYGLIKQRYSIGELTMPINQTVQIKASPSQVYKALLSAKEFGEVTGAPAEISTEEGGAFSCFGGQIVGRHVELIPNERIVQAWRVAEMWAEGAFSIVSFKLTESDGLTTIDMEHGGYPADFGEHLEGGWHKMYWEPLKAHFA